MKTYQKINTMYKRYAFDGKTCPNKGWLKLRNKIIIDDFSDEEVKYLFNNEWEAYSKIDGTNSKIAYFPSTCEIKVGGKTDNASSQSGQFEFLLEIAERIKPILMEMFPKECARFTPVRNKDSKKIQYYDATNGEEIVAPMCADKYTVALEEIPIYIYGEYFGKGIQKCGKRYIENGNDFLVFDINQQGWWLPKNKRDEMCTALGLKTVPFLGIMTLEEIENKVKKGFPTQYENANDASLIEEGIVARPIVPIYNSKGERIIVKVKYNDYVELASALKDMTDEEFKEFKKWYNSSQTEL